MGLEFEYGSELGGGNGSDVPFTGTYKVLTGEVTEKPDKGGTKYGIPLIIQEGEYEGQYIWENIFWDTENETLNSISKKKLANLAKASGCPEHMNDWTLEIEGRSVVVKSKPAKNPDFRDLRYSSGVLPETNDAGRQKITSVVMEEAKKDPSAPKDEIPF